MTKFAEYVVLPVALVSMVTLLGACAATKQVALPTPTMAAPTPGSAFLPDPSLLQPGKTGQVDQVYLNSNANWGSYTKVMLDPVTIWSGRGSNMDKASLREQKALADSFYTDLHTAVSKKCQMVTEPTPGTMRWQIALVDASSANPFLNTLSTYEPHVHLLVVVAGYAFNDGVGYWVGQATAEGYARDAMTGTLLWEGQDKRAGTKNMGRDTLNSWDDVDNAFKAWAAQFAKRLDELGACPQK
ncbi:MAG: DUF3313 domain-containing protein [Deltaproteobacteria bacterium]|nr:DUF3313 domain-containing protein [Deltaproteobacteria bacterium]